MTDNDHREESLLHGLITAVKSDRRSFLSRAVGTAGTFALGALSVGACSGSGANDTCDADLSDADPYDNDPVDRLGDAPGRGGDPRCDSD